MAHNLNFNENRNQHAFFSVKEKAWHGLGQIVTDYPTSAQAIKLANLDYNVIKQPLYTINNEGSTKAINNFFATVRQDTGEPLGVVGRKYEIIQNIDAFSFFDSIIGGDGILYETAGALGAGEKIFITAKLPNYIKVGRNDLIEQYIFLTNAHDGSAPITAAFTPIRIVCNNTLNMALRNMANSVTIRHTADAKARLDQAHKIMGISNNLAGELSTIFNRWAKIRITDPELLRLIKLAMSPNKEVFEAVATGNTNAEFSKQFEEVCSQVYEYANTCETQQMQTTAGTLFGAYNAITGYYQNVKEYKSADNKFNSIMYGTGLDRTKKAFDLCLNASDFLN
jgi:phage/plasmid-like protein (TIGR03299 family)